MRWMALKGFSRSALGGQTMQGCGESVARTTFLGSTHAQHVLAVGSQAGCLTFLHVSFPSKMGLI